MLLRWLLLLLLGLYSFASYSETKTIHIFVALCDNANQGIVPVPKSLGNGQDPHSNLYWGAAYGVKTWFKKPANGWKLVQIVKDKPAHVLERLLFKHQTEDAYLLADAWDGKYIKNCTEALLKSANGQNHEQITHEEKSLGFGGQANLLCYAGHDGLMEFDVSIEYKAAPQKKKEIIILACYSKDFFSPEVKKAGAVPLVWTTHLMAPEAYTLQAAIDGWLKKESADAIESRAEVAYNKYQKCGMKGARALFTSGF